MSQANSDLKIQAIERELSRYQKSLRKAARLLKSYAQFYKHTKAKIR